MHADYTDDSALLGLARSIQSKQGLAGGRFMAINVWRPISQDGPVQCWPLAVCDGRSVAPETLRPRETPENNNWVLNARPVRHALPPSVFICFG